LSNQFHLILIKPIRYDDDGYPARWSQPLISSSTLSCMYGLAEDCRLRQVLGEQIEIIVHAFDETFETIDVAGLITIVKASGKALVGLVGVQTNQFPRAVDIARPFLEHDIPVCIGGFHVSGCKSMLREMPDDIK